MNEAQVSYPLTLNLVEDDPAIRQDLCRVFHADPRFTLCDTADCVRGGMAALKDRKPEVLLVDIGLPDGSGIDLIRAVHELQLDTMPMVISGFHDEYTVFEALKAGAQGYILKHDDHGEVREAVLQMVAGGSPISPVIARMVLSSFKPAAPKAELPETLTERQLVILKYVSQGFTSKEIAEKLGLSYHTVTTHVKHIYNKLQVNSRAEAIHEALQQGLLT